jgi:glycosyltransferase involved in cell wall biosynthesis
VQQTTLSVILPVYNAAGYLAQVVQDCLLIVPQHVAEYELIIVDDASRDETAAIAYQLAAAHEPVMVLRHTHRRGYGRALAHGLRNARGDYLLTLDSAGTISISELTRLLPYMPHYDLIQGYRLQQWARAWRMPLLALLRRWANWQLQTDLHDLDCRFSLLRARALATMPLASAGPLLHSEIYARARQQQASSIQVGVNEGRPRRKRAVGSWPTPMAFWHVLALRRRVRAHVGGNAWPSRVALGIGLVALLRGAWQLLRRRSSDA